MSFSASELQERIKEGESETLEFKTNFGAETIETAGAFANTRGGIILIGVDRGGTIQGVTASGEHQKDWTNRISQLSEPTLIPSISVVELNGKDVVAFFIREFPVKPVAIRGRCYRRVGASNRVMTPAEISEMHLQSVGTTWDGLPHPHFGWDDIDQKKLEDYVIKAKAVGRRNVPENMELVTLAQKLELVIASKPSWASVIAFGKQPPLQAKVKCGKIRGTSTIVDDFVVDAPLLKQVDEVMNYLKRVFMLSYTFSGKAQREEIWEYPLEAVREVVTNAICHRDYSSPAQIQIKIFDDRLVIWNPGGLPFGMTMEKLMQPTHGSVPRNKLVAMLFYDTKLIESYGSGIQRVLEECERLGFPEPEFENEQGGFRVTFYKDMYTEEYLQTMGLNERQVKAVLYLKEKRKITNKEYRELTGISDEGARIDLNVLVSKGLLESKGSGRGTHYVLKKFGD